MTEAPPPCEWIDNYGRGPCGLAEKGTVASIVHNEKFGPQWSMPGGIDYGDGVYRIAHKFQPRNAKDAEIAELRAAIGPVIQAISKWEEHSVRCKTPHSFEHFLQDLITAGCFSSTLYALKGLAPKGGK